MRKTILGLLEAPRAEKFADDDDDDNNITNDEPLFTEVVRYYVLLFV